MLEQKKSTQVDVAGRKKGGQKSWQSLGFEEFF